MITYGTENYMAATSRLTDRALSTGWFRSVRNLGPSDLNPAFRTRFADILARPRGGGYWIWKWDVINSTLQRMQFGEYLVYLDAGCHINTAAHARLLEYFSMIQQRQYKVIAFTAAKGPTRLDSRLSEKFWTVSRIFDYFGVTDNASVTDTPQLENNVILLQKSSNAFEWLAAVRAALEFDPELTTDFYNDESRRLHPDYFVENRHDQSIASVAHKKLGGILLKYETHCGRGCGPFWACRDDAHHTWFDEDWAVAARSPPNMSSRLECADRKYHFG